ncbi:translocation/assembly module TamB domain-containing protein [Nitratireductor mangrovi]|nr:translocation/assembly module TamB domain-containing protein [Nitratireductor mangrovi]
MLRRLTRILLVSILLVLAFVAGMVAIFTQTDAGKAKLAAFASALASSADSKVRISGLSGILSGKLRIASVVVEDREGPWLSAAGVELDWAPLALAGFDFHAERLAAQRIEVSRAPFAGEEEAGANEPLSLPVSLRVDRLDLPDIVIGAALAGEAVRLKASGSASADDQPLRFKTDLDAERTDGRKTVVNAKVDFAPGENRLDLDVAASEPEGGFIATLLKLPGAPAVEITLAGSGPLADWQGQGAMKIDGRAATSIAARHRETEAGRHIAANGEGDFRRFLPEGLMPLAEGTMIFDFAATLGDDGAVAIEHAVLQSDAVSAEASGRVDPEGESDLDVVVKAVDDPVMLTFGAGADPVIVAIRSARAAITGSGAAPAVDGTIDLSSAQGAGFGVADIKARLASPGFDLRRWTGPVSFELAAGGVGTVNTALAPLVAGPLEMSGEARLETERVSIEKLEVKNRQVGLAGTGGLAPETGAADATISAQIVVAALPEAARRYLGERLKVSGRFERGADGALSASNLELNSDPLTARGNVSLAEGQVEAALAGAYGAVARLSDQAQGAIDFQLAATGDITRPEVELRVASERIESAGRAITDLVLEAKGTADPAKPVADVNLSGAIEGETIDGRARLRSAEGGGSRVEELLVSVGENRISGTLDLDAAFVPVGDLELALPDITPLAAMALEEAAGNVSGTISFRKDGAVPTVDLVARTDRLSRGDLTVEKASVRMGVRDYLAQPTIAGRVEAEAVRTGGTEIAKIGVDLSRDGEWTGFSGSATVTGIPAAAAGRVRIADGETTVELASAKGAFRGIQAALASATTVRVRDGTAYLDRMALGVEGGTAEVTGSAGEALDLTVKLASLPASLANSFAPGLAAAGSVSGTVKIAGAAADPRITYDVDWRGAATSQTREAGFGALSLASTGSFEKGRLRFDARAGDGGGLGLNGGGTVNTVGGVSLDTRFAGKVPFSFLTQRLAAQGLALDGGANVEVAVSGAAASPVLSGSVKTSGARLVDARSGIAVRDIAADIGLARGVATIRSMTGELSTGGRLSVGGTVAVDPARGFPADLTARVSDGRYTDGRVVTANFGGNLKVTGSLTNVPELSGQVDLGKTIITVPDKLPASIATLDVKHRNATGAVEAQAKALRPAEASGGGSGLTLDVVVDAPRQIFIQGRGIDAEFGGRIRLTGPVSSPRAIGNFTMRRGRLSILGQRLDFTRGTLDFAGSMVPRLDFAADTQADDVTATIGVVGEANNPRFEFSSSPSLPEDEVLARLVFGRSLSNLSPLQIAQLAAAAAQLAGVGGSTSLLDKLRNQIGVDDIDIKTDAETGRASVAVGKYLNDRTYVGIEKGEGAGTGKARIDLNIGRGVKLRGEASDSGEAKGGIFFEREY